MSHAVARFGGKRNMLSLGTYPDATLAVARRKADAVRHRLAEGFDRRHRFRKVVEGNPTAFVRDPAGNLIEFLQPFVEAP